MADENEEVESPPADDDKDDSPEHIRELTEKIELLKAQKEEVDKQIEEDDMESKTHIIDSMKARDRLKQVHREKEEASVELRRRGNHLDKVNRSAQSRKAAKEKQLQQKKTERQKIKQEIARWDREIF